MMQKLAESMKLDMRNPWGVYYDVHLFHSPNCVDDQTDEVVWKAVMHVGYRSDDSPWRWINEISCHRLIS